MIIKYELKIFLKDKGIKQSFIAKKIGISKQLFNSQLKKGDLSLSSLTIIAENTNISVEKLTKLLNEKYTRIKI